MFSFSDETGGPHVSLHQPGPNKMRLQCDNHDRCSPIFALFPCEPVQVALFTCGVRRGTNKEAFCQWVIVSQSLLYPTMAARNQTFGDKTSRERPFAARRRDIT